MMKDFARLLVALVMCVQASAVNAQDPYSMYWNAQYNAAVAHANRGMQQLNEMGQAFVKGFGESLRESSRRIQEEFERNPNNQLSMAISRFANGDDEEAVKHLVKIILDDEGNLNSYCCENYPQTMNVALKYIGYCYELGLYFDKDNENARSYYASGEAEDELERIRTSGYITDVATGIKNFRMMCMQINVSAWQASQGVMTMPSYSGFSGSSSSSSSSYGGTSQSTCMQCYGTGHCQQCSNGVTTYSYTQTKGICSICDGSGKCTSCRGTGKR